MRTNSLKDFINELNKLPSIGPKTAMRLAIFFARLSNAEAGRFVDSLRKMKETIRPCKECFNLADSDICEICCDDKRDRSVICVVENVTDVWSLERSGEYPGYYHVLGGSLNPLKGIHPDNLSFNRLTDRIKKNNVNEIIIATNPNTEGEMTAIYIHRLLKPFNIKITRLAYGLPVGSDLEFADVVTLSRAVTGRQVMNVPRETG